MPRVDLAFTVNKAQANQLRDIAAAMKKAGRTDLRRDLGKAIRVAADDTVKDLRRSVKALPSRSNTGLRASIARAIGVQVTTTSRRTAIRIHVNRKRLPAGKRGMADAFEKGAWRHPVYADSRNETRKEWTWERQTIPGPWFQPVVDRHKDDFVKAVDKILDDFKRKLEAT